MQLSCFQVAGDAHHLVSILTRPEGRVQREVVAHVVAADADVSILTRPEGRVQLPPPPPPLPGSKSFQSSPGQKAGCNAGVWVTVASGSSFQSSPGQKAGCNPLNFSGASLVLFQSSPGQKAGCNPRWPACSTLIFEFQSSPGQKAGCNCWP